MSKPHRRILVASLVVLFWTFIYIAIPQSKPPQELSDTGQLCYTNGFCIDYYNQYQCFETYNTEAHAHIAPMHRTEASEDMNEAQIAYMKATYVQRAQSNDDALLADLDDEHALAAEDHAEACVESAIQAYRLSL